MHRLTPFALVLVASLLVGTNGRAQEFVEKRADGVTVVNLTQSPCLFLESEKDAASYTSTRKADCVGINARTLPDRTLSTLRLAPGKTIFRVTNLNVPYTVGFYLRGKGLSRVTLPSASGGGLDEGVTKEYEIDLVSGEYLYSCPLNPTPDYKIVVTG